MRGKLRVIVLFALVLALLDSKATSGASNGRVTQIFSAEISRLRDLEVSAEKELNRLKNLNVLAYESKIAAIDLERSTSYRLLQIGDEAKLISLKNQVEQAILNWKEVSSVRLTTGFFGSDLARAMNVLDCIPPYSDGSSGSLIVKRNCANDGTIPRPGDRSSANPQITIGGADWQQGDVTTVSINNADNEYLQKAISFGFVVPLNKSEFTSRAKQYRLAVEEIEALGKSIPIAKRNIEDLHQKKSAEVSNEVRLENNLLDRQHLDFEAKLDFKIGELKIGQQAARRAARQKVNEEVAFDTALKFSYNSRRLDQLARSSLSEVRSLKSLLSLVEINRLSQLADSVDQKYTHAQAMRINSLCGKTFIREREFGRLQTYLKTVTNSGRGS